MGTRFLCAEECTVHENYKAKIIKAGDLATAVTGKRLGHPVRSLRTAFTREYIKAEYSGISDEELEALGAGALRMAAKEGSEEKGCFMSGQSAALVHKIEPAAEIIRSVVDEAEPLLKGAPKWAE